MPLTPEHKSAYDREHYLRNRDELLAKWRRATQEDVAFLRSLRNVPCADCGGVFPPYVMDFDHRDPTQKSFEITRVAGRVNRQKLLEEIAKCDIVCSNCHRVRTYKQQIARQNAGVAQLEERKFSKLDVAGSSPVSRSEQLRWIEEAAALYDIAA